MRSPTKHDCKKKKRARELHCCTFDVVVLKKGLRLRREPAKRPYQYTYKTKKALKQKRKDKKSCPSQGQKKFHKFFIKKKEKGPIKKLKPTSPKSATERSLDHK